MNKGIPIIAGTSIVALLAVTFAATLRGAPSCAGSVVAGNAIGGPFEMVNQDGVTVTQADVVTEPTILYFGYTFCPDVCPIDNARNVAAVDILYERGYDVTPAFATIDPERDTVGVMSVYSENMHPKMIGLTGSLDQIREAAAAYRVVYSKQDDDPEYYLMNHSVFSYLVMPETGFADFFRREVTPEQMADRIACFIDAA